MTHGWIRAALIALGIGLGLSCAACGGSSGGGGGGGGGGDGAAGERAPTIQVTTPIDWPSDVAAVLSESSPDPTGDFETNHPGDAPPVLIPHAPGDVTRIQLGIEGDSLYIRLDFAAPLPTAPVAVPAQGGVAAQTVEGQSFSLVVNADQDTTTGGGASPWLEGVELYFAINLRYGVDTLVYVNWDFEDGDLHKIRGQAHGVVGEGGPGQAFVVVRYDLRSIPQRFFPRGQTVRVGSWVESESDLFHEMAVDTVLIDQPWFVPAQ